MNLITKLTPEQKALIPVYINKWQQIAFSTAETNKDKAIAAVKQVYSLINKPELIIIFCDRPALAELGCQPIGNLNPVEESKTSPNFVC